MIIQSTVIIRDRGQLTIPEKIRAKRQWASAASVVTIATESPDEIIIRPHPAKKVDWDKLWKDLKRVRAYKGKGRGNLSQFIAQDRQTRR